MQQRWVLSVSLCSLITVGLSLLTTDQVQAASGNGPYYAEPSWSQKLSAATRFVVLTDWNNEAVLDRETGLVWERSPDTTSLTWDAARIVCLRSTKGGRMGWRLPAIAELASLIDPSVAVPDPALPPGHPFTNGPFTVYWSATTFANDPTSAWVVDFRSRPFLGGFGKTLSPPVWCVRGAMNADAY